MPTPKSPKKSINKKADAKKPAASKITKKKAAPAKRVAKLKPALAPAAIAAPQISADLENAARIALRDCMKVSAGETVAIITDENKRNIGVAMWNVAK